MMLCEVIVQLQALWVKHGDVKVFIPDNIDNYNTDYGDKYEILFDPNDTPGIIFKPI